MWRKRRTLTLLVLLAISSGAFFVAQPRAYAQSCESEETAGEECFIDVPGTEPLPAPEGAYPAPSGVYAVPAVPIRPVPRGVLRIWTDRRLYYVGDTIQVCFRVPAPGYIRITDVMPDGYRQVLWEWYDDGRGDCMYAYITPPVGTECLILRYDMIRGPYYYPYPDPATAAGVEAARIEPPVRRTYYARACFETRWSPPPPPWSDYPGPY